MSRNPLLDPGARLVIAHRGNSIALPENTMDALRQAMELGADALEFDVRMTRDQVPVLMHDADLDRTTMSSGALRNLTFDELQQVRIRSADAPSDGRRVPSLEEALDAFRALPLVIEVKEMAAAEATARLVRKFGAESRVLVGSVENRVMEWFYRSGLASCASMLDAALLIPFAFTGIKAPKPMYDVLSLTPTYHGLPIPILRMATAAHRLGVPTQVWTVNDPTLAKSLWAGGVAGIITDDPAAILRARSA